MKKNLCIATFGAALMAVPAFAFQPGGTLGSFVQETQQFRQLVRQLGAAPIVEQATDRLTIQMRQLRQCVRRAQGGNALAARNIPRACRLELQDVRQVVNRIDGMGIRKRPLLRQFNQVKFAASQLRIAQGPGGGVGLVKCVAADNGWEEHFGGHVAYGRGIRNAQQAALRECQRSHGSCRIIRCE